MTGDCAEQICDYEEPHEHGPACGPLCPCGLGMQAILDPELEARS